MDQTYVARLRTSSPLVPDMGVQNVSSDSYGRLVVQNLSTSDHQAADEGSYFIATAGVAGSTAVIPVGPASAVPADTTPFFILVNTAVPGVVGASNIWLKRIYVLLSGTQTSETSLTIQGQLDQGVNFYTSGGTAMTVNNANPLATNKSFARAYYGAPGKNAKTAGVLYVARSNPRSTIPVTGDEYIWKFGATEGPTSFISSTAGATRQVIDTAALVIPPGWTFSLHAAFGATSTGAPAIELEAGWIER